MSHDQFEKRSVLFVAGNMHLLHGPLVNREQAARSAAVDAAADREWFRQHPEANERIRPASHAECAAHGHPPGTEVAVIRRSDGSQIRVMLLRNRTEPRSQ